MDFIYRFARFLMAKRIEFYTDTICGAGAPYMFSNCGCFWMIRFGWRLHSSYAFTTSLVGHLDYCSFQFSFFRFFHHDNGPSYAEGFGRRCIAKIVR
jgi:hypothetical protein